MIEECFVWRYEGEPGLNVDSECEFLFTLNKRTRHSRLFELLAMGYKDSEQIRRHNFRKEPNHQEMERFRDTAREVYSIDHKSCWALLGVKIQEKHAHSDSSL